MPRWNSYSSNKIPNPELLHAPMNKMITDWLIDWIPVPNSLFRTHDYRTIALQFRWIMNRYLSRLVVNFRSMYSSMNSQLSIYQLSVSPYLLEINKIHHEHAMRTCRWLQRRGATMFFRKFPTSLALGQATIGNLCELLCKLRCLKRGYNVANNDNYYYSYVNTLGLITHEFIIRMWYLEEGGCSGICSSMHRSNVD